jgi:preprotein translocase subunit YajC
MITLQCLAIIIVELVVFTFLTVREQRIQDNLNKED